MEYWNSRFVWGHLGGGSTDFISVDTGNSPELQSTTLFGCLCKQLLLNSASFTHAERAGARGRKQAGRGREEGQGTYKVGVHAWSGEFINKRTILQIYSNALHLKWFKTQTWTFSSIIGHMLSVKHHGITLCFNVTSSTATANKYNVFSYFTFLHLYNLSEFTYQNSK